MKRFAPHIFASYLILMIFMPFFVGAQTGNIGVVPCDEVTVKCDFGKAVTLVQNIINKLIEISTLIVVALLIFTGFELLTSGGNEGKMKEAKARLGKVLMGYLFILTAWLLVYTIVNVLTDDPGYSLLQKP